LPIHRKCDFDMPRHARASISLRAALRPMVLALAFSFGVALPPAAPAAQAAEPVCTISAKLVNSCRPWLGAESGGYGVSAFRARMLEHEARIGRQVDIVHGYLGAGNVVLTNDMVTLAQRPATIALINWRVTFNWASGDGRSATVNQQIDTMADSVKALGSTKIMLTIHHEPEPNISPGGSPSCPNQTFNGTSGSTTDYVAMWHNVRARFDARGVTNVVWVMNYMGYPTWDCVVEDLWPGNDYVDWVMWDPYPRSTSWTQRVGHFYDLLTARSDPEHDFLSKPWGLGEFGYQGTSQTVGYATYAEARANIDSGVHPRLKAYVVWDNKISTSLDNRVGFTLGGVRDPLEQEHYNAFANNPTLTGTAVPEPTDQTPPVVGWSAPEDAAIVSGRIGVSGTASDDEELAEVQLLVDDDPAGTAAPDAEGTVALTWNTATVPNGAHTLRLWARDASGNTAVSEPVTVTVENVDEEPPTPPSDLTGTWGTPNRVTLGWTAAEDDGAVTGYRVYRDGDLVTTLGPGAREYVDTDVTNLSTYTYVVSAVDAADNESEPSNEVQVVTGDDTPPSTPITAAALSDVDEAMVTWSESTDNDAVTSYRVYRNGALLTEVDGQTTVLVDGGLDDATTYSYRVRAYDAAGHSSGLSEPAVVTTTDATAPSPPTELAAVSAPASVALTWKVGSDNVAVTNHVVYRDGLPVATLGATATSWTDSALVGPTLHRYQVTARDAAGLESTKSNEVARTIDQTAPSVPGNLRAASTSTSVALTWNPSTDDVGVSGYVVYRDGLPVATPGATATTWTDNALVGSTLHRYRVAARDASGNESAKSNEVARTLADTTAPTAPTRLARTISGFTVRLTWTASTDNVGVTGYTIYRGGVAIGTSTTPAYTDLTPPLGRTSTYTVRARDAAGNLSAASASVSAAVPADTTRPTTPTNLRATAGATGTRRIVLTWSASTDNVGVTSYHLYRGGAKYRLLGNVTTYTDTGLTAGTRYTYKVYAIDGSGNWSGASTSVSATAR
jgi:fibronectin type 3 domain-containing protein